MIWFLAIPYTVKGEGRGSFIVLLWRRWHGVLEVDRVLVFVLSTLPLRVLPPKGDRNTLHPVQRSCPPLKRGILGQYTGDWGTKVPSPSKLSLPAVGMASPARGDRVAVGVDRIFWLDKCKVYGNIDISR
jgi:hypothetical protein